METEPDLYLPNLSEYINFEKSEEKNQINLVMCGEFLNQLSDKIKKVEIYYNPYTTELINNISNAEVFNIITQKEV